MVGRNRRLECGEDKNLALRADLKNRAAAVAHIQAAPLVEGYTRGDSHSFDPLHRAAIGRNTVNGSVVAARDEKISVLVERQAGRIHQLGDERLYGVIRRDLVER